ncbi:MAG: peptide chain release factor N(5)-glutamine methyltransferase, partial [Candidatus Methylomirabilia bacterium]
MKRTSAPETVGDLLGEAQEFLQGARLSTPRLDGERLLAGLLGKKRGALALECGCPVSLEVAERFRTLLVRRRQGEPLQYLLGWEEFCGLRLKVTPEILIPRPETELLVEWARGLLDGSGGRDGRSWEGLERNGPGGSQRARVALDLGTGSGAIACAIARSIPDLNVVGVDRSAGALAVARENVRALGLSGRVQLVQGDLFEPLIQRAGRVDLVIANPPYIASDVILTLPREVRDYEPVLALDGGPDGMAVHRRIIGGAPEILRSGGWLLMEFGEG